jgi:hypothetical protein
VVAHSLSPAYAGGAVVDDGKAVTFVSRFRSPCPSDPLPMPIETRFAFALPKHAARAYREASCTIPPHCD